MGTRTAHPKRSIKLDDEITKDGGRHHKSVMSMHLLKTAFSFAECTAGILGEPQKMQHDRVEQYWECL